MRINPNGNVGIGTKNPIGKLNIEGSVESGEERAFIRMKNYATGPNSSVSIALQAFDDKGVSRGTLNNSGVLEFSPVACP